MDGHGSRPGDRMPVHYTMKTNSRHATAPGAACYHGHSNPTTHPPRASRSKSTTTPVASPRGPYSVGQNNAPMLSPTRHADARAPSPNYFGLVIEPSNDPRDSSCLARDNWSPASSSVKSFTAALPKQLPSEPNSDFEAFKRQADLNNRGKAFSLPASHHAQPTSRPAAALRSRPLRWHPHASSTAACTKEHPSSSIDADCDSLHDAACLSADSKCTSASPSMPMQITAMPRHESPRPMDASQHRPAVTRTEDRDGRLSLMMDEHPPYSPRPSEASRAATLPPKLEPGMPCMISGEHLKELMDTIDDARLLLLDIRSSQSFTNSRIRGALNLCIPTTLLKRATFNLQKLQQTFQGGLGSNKFAEWRHMHWIVVYDAHASDKRDAPAALNMINKFTNGGYTGNTAILRGGFTMAQKLFPKLVDYGPAVPSAGQAAHCTGQSQGSGITPVVGGVKMPQSTNQPDPFFCNIRQNLDLADGVGQLEVSRPPGLVSPLLPHWLREAVSKTDHGKKVSDRFLGIELDEQTRMKSAYAAFNPNAQQQGSRFQLSGVEKGGKNRYKDILPFEHARVRLHNKPAGSCDYINASHLMASRTNKRYIASQGPLPATFEDFWSVIWEQDVRVIVMLTAESEGGQLKCHSYWKGREFGAIRLRPLSEKKVLLDSDRHRSNDASSAQADTDMAKTMTSPLPSSSTPNGSQQSDEGKADVPYVTVRKFALTHTAYPFAPMREITHLHFAAWPDFGTPARPSHLLALVELANVMQRAALPLETASIVSSRPASMDSTPPTWHDEPEDEAHARPMLVHCSAGCGRTGTFCAVDSVVDMLKRQRLARRTHDRQGDVAMAHSDQDVSRGWCRGVTDHEFKRQALGGRALAGPDASWLQDDTADLIQKTVEDFREQRLSMVQSLRQYVLCYETVLEWVNRTECTAERQRRWEAGGEA